MPGQNRAVLSFGKPITYLILEPRTARDIAMGLLNAANVAEFSPADIEDQEARAAQKSKIVVMDAPKIHTPPGFNPAS